ncbi:MAG: alpha/beta fold hydrolase [Actinobacteria bacterium]|nr:alpha/beta fold hydrolase [Actinomycetota bacterium]MBV8961049.1 alpha/beta fold hydrolase [Actinomycetota bacterium]MBV9254151.1 alpha/beta fold hydrolase [Actinomycetota bacterium]MBV9663496.1 alpha/beta fold hydrolase [Actinomycetota bacterium]MBV9935431.1 alpha/beta fold hydrolase [Actinomycetota bacterium]
MPTFSRAFGQTRLQLHFAERGASDGMPVVLTHGLLWSSRMMEGLAARLPDQRVLLLDLHGHGKSDRPTDPSAYTWASLAGDVIALLDHLEIDQAVIGGLSLGANVTLAAGQRHPERVKAMIVEMPVLRRGEPFGRPAFGAMAGAYEAGGRSMTALAGLVRKLPLPRGVPELAALRDVAGAEPAVAVAVLRGLLAEDLIPDDSATIARMHMPALVIGHRRDPVHVLDDARDLARRLPKGELVEASSIAEFRLHPERLAAHVRHFLERLPA